MKSAFFSSIVIRRSLIVLALLTTYYLLLTTYLATPAFAQECEAIPPGDNYGKEVIDQLNKCAIEEDIFDDKVFNFNQIAGTADSLLTLLMGYSQLHPETNELTK